MKKLIEQALNDAYLKLERQVPQTTKQYKEINIKDVKPIDLQEFMKINSIPDDAYFSGGDSAYDACYEITLCWEVDVPMAEEDKITFRRNRFSEIAFKFVYDLLIENNYKRIPWDSCLGRQFKDTTVYDMYVNKDFDSLGDYYLLSFAQRSMFSFEFPSN